MQAVPLPSASQPAIWKKLLLVLLIAAGLVAVLYFDLSQLLSLESVKLHRDRLLRLTEDHYVWAVTLFIGSYVIVTAVSLPGATIMTLAGGFLFGVGWGVLYVNIGATFGATLAFLAARYVLRDWVETTFGRRFAAIEAGFRQDAVHYLLMLRVVPVFPFFLVNLVAGMTRIPLSTYIVGTAVGIVPASVVYTYAGRQLGTLDSLGEIASPSVLLALALLGLLALVPVLYRKATGGGRLPGGEGPPFGL